MKNHKEASDCQENPTLSKTRPTLGSILLTKNTEKQKAVMVMAKLKKWIEEETSEPEDLDSPNHPCLIKPFKRKWRDNKSAIKYNSKQPGSKDRSKERGLGLSTISLIREEKSAN